MQRFRSIATAVIVLIAGLLLGTADAAQAQQAEKKVIRIGSARGVNFVALWGLGPFAEKHGLRTEMVAVISNADQQRALQAGGGGSATPGNKNPAVLAAKK